MVSDRSRLMGERVINESNDVVNHCYLCLGSVLAVLH